METPQAEVLTDEQLAAYEDEITLRKVLCILAMSGMETHDWAQARTAILADWPRRKPLF